uniref:LRRCT domain-containing protein n=1 Tax=Anopheles atroparvus TaxID=41427 RepID=A0AAG5D1U6_ANOAO
MRILRMLLFVLVMCAIAANTADFEDGTSICDKCTCLVANSTTTVLSYDLLDCSRSNLLHMFDNWPKQFETSNPQREIVVSLSGNEMTQLQPLPPTSASLVFSCRHCKLENLASGLFLDTPNVLRADLSWNKLDGYVLSSDVFRGQYHEEENYASLSLDVLDLGYNVITQLTDDVFKYVTSLRRLSLAYNALGKISESTATALKQLIHLEYLDLSYSSLTHIDSEIFIEMHALQELLIQGNKLTVIPDAVFHTTSLVSLNLGENPIDTLNMNKPLHKLHHLNMSSMPALNRIHVDSFQNVKSLRSLTCRNNTALEVFDLAILGHAINLQQLDLSQSSLKHLSPPNRRVNDSLIQNSLELQSNLNSLEILELADNPWHCDCDLQLVLTHVGLKLDTEKNSRCETPNMLISLHLSELTHIDVCDLVVNETPKNSIYEKPAFLRPRAIFLTLLSIGIVVGVGIVIGLIIVCLKRRLTDNGIGFTSPVRYTSVRESTPSAVYQL